MTNRAEYLARLDKEKWAKREDRIKRWGEKRFDNNSRQSESRTDSGIQESDGESESRGLQRSPPGFFRGGGRGGRGGIRHSPIR